MRCLTLKPDLPFAFDGLPDTLRQMADFLEGKVSLPLRQRVLLFAVIQLVIYADDYDNSADVALSLNHLHALNYLTGEYSL